MQLLMSEFDKMFPIRKISSISPGLNFKNPLMNNDINMYLVPDIKTLDSMSADTEKSSNNIEQPFVLSGEKSGFKGSLTSDLMKNFLVLK